MADAKDAKDTSANGTEVKSEDKAVESSPNQRGRGGRGKFFIVITACQSSVYPGFLSTDVRINFLSMGLCQMTRSSCFQKRKNRC